MAELLVVGTDWQSLSGVLAYHVTCVRLTSTPNSQTCMFYLSVLQHSQMLVVRKEGKAHDRYNSFRSAFELLETVGREPGDSFQEMADDLPPLQTLEKKMTMQITALLQEIDELKADRGVMQNQIQFMQQQIESMQQHRHEIQSQNPVDILMNDDDHMGH